MDLTTFLTPNVPPKSHVARLARILAERLDPNDEYDCEVAITTTTNDAIENHSANDMPSRGYEYRYTDYGIELTISFTNNTDCPDTRASKLVSDYSDSLDREHGITFMSSFRGSDGYCHALAFPVLDEEFTCGVTNPSWA